MIDDMLRRFNRGEDIFLTRYKKGKFRDGVYEASVLFRRRLLASVQPLTERDEVRLPEGQLNRITSGVKIFTTEELKTGNPDKGTRADDIEIDGVLYQVDSVESWSFDDLSHYEAIAMKVTK